MPESFCYKQKQTQHYGKESACNASGLDWIPGLGRSPAEGNGDPLHYSCQENPLNAGAWWAVVYAGHKESDTLSDSHFHFSRRNYR